MAYDWRKELGTVSGPKKGQRSKNELFWALDGSEEERKRAVKVLTRALGESKGRLEDLSVLLGCTYPVAFRLIRKADLQPLATTLRVAHGVNGPTGKALGGAKRPKKMTEQSE